jgi:hypothetical protein
MLNIQKIERRGGGGGGGSSSNTKMRDKRRKISMKKINMPVHIV